MTSRADFPVLERYAYLNAGTNGPLARATVEALVAEAERDLARGRSGQAYIDRILERRDEARQGLAAVLGVDSAHVALVDSTTRGCGVVLAGLGLGGEDEVLTTDRSISPCSARCTRRARESSSPKPTRMRSLPPSRP